MFTKGETVMIYFDEWVAGPDGRDYRAAWGPVTYFEAKAALGFVPKGDSNWFVQIGDGDGAIIVAGCRIHYAYILRNPPTDTARCYIP